ncbi:GMC oxidoreductase family protein [Abortiporus biennis]
MSPTNTEYDVIFAGGGTAACLIAGRLAKADPSLKILLLEAGPHTREELQHVQPAKYLTHLHPASTTVKFMVAKPNPNLDGRQVIVPCGQCVGGGSSVNFVMYTRAAASDYDDWETIYGNKGWSSKELIPLLRKTETYQVAPGKDETHGYSGPLKVSYAGPFSNIGKEFLEVGSKYDTTRGNTDDPNGLFHVNKFGRWQRWVDSETGRRSDTAHNFVYNQSDNKNLELVAGALVKRVIFEGKRAVGVEYILNKKFNPEDAQDVHTVKARKLVIVSSGPFGSPAVLERSGIGAKDLLTKLGVDVRVDLPGVGSGYQDHQVIFPPYLASEESITLDGIVRSNPSDEKWSAQWAKDGSGLMAHNALDAGVKIRPSEEELKAIGPEFTERWKSYFENAPDKPAMWIGAVSMLVGDVTTTPNRKYFSLGYYVEYPTSFGSVHITDGEDVYASQEFDAGYLQTADDLAILKYGYKRSREFARRLPAYRGEFAPSHPQFPAGSAAAIKADSQPVPINASDIVYTEEDEKAIVEYTKKAVGTAWHSLGTCAMKPREDGGVVDSKLNVYGTEGLKVADLSIAPGNVSANTYSTALVVAEKATLIIAEELGITGA